jgi:trimeric autotransporter adhesin
VFVNAEGKLGAQVSSRRFKEEIKPLDQASEALFALKPVSFRYKKEIDSTAASQFGLVAEDVEKVNPDLVIRDKEGNPFSVRYDQVNAMLLNEFLKEHATVQELKNEIAAFKASLQELSDQLKMSRPVQFAENSQ